MAQLYFSYKYVFLDLDKTFIEMSNTSHLPVSQPDNEKEFLHETQLVVLDSAGTRLSNLNTIKVVAYVSGKGSLYTVSKWMSYVRLLRLMKRTVNYLFHNFSLHFQGRFSLDQDCNIQDEDKLCSRIKLTWRDMKIHETRTSYLNYVLKRCTTYLSKWCYLCIKISFRISNSYIVMQIFSVIPVWYKDSSLMKYSWLVG